MIDSLEQILTSLLANAHQVFQFVGFWPVLVLAYLFGGYIFWRWCKIAQKNTNSVFDLWFLTTTLMVLWSRVSFIIANSTVFLNLPWTVFPYERYGDQIYLFRTLPWKFVSIWDGGYFFSGLAVSFLFVATNYIVFVKKWRWRDMYKPVMLSLHFMFSVILIVYGVLLQSQRITLLSLGIFIMFVVFLIVDKILSKSGKKNYLGVLVYVLIVTGIEVYIFFSSQITDIDRVNIFILGVYTLFVSMMYVIDILKKDAVQEAYIPTIRTNITTNKPIKIKTVK